MLHFTPHLQLMAQPRRLDPPWITNWNENPRPYIWHKSADELLDSLANYCQRISDQVTRRRRVECSLLAPYHWSQARMPWARVQRLGHYVYGARMDRV